ncbi:phospholipase D-like domain-containing protein [Haloprofundus marisrubri]|uniref:phospholipase D-like domain-containing protein n=1 Tax=Haloprofundus marisrubri TaxID=1514971 RepID=UPI001F0A4A1A|nr:phospholipase D-like domain-containing protein [Haloprofundus marisrubri]
MTRAFSLASKSLGYFIGYTLLHADEIAICSPWLSNVELRFPVNDALTKRRMTLSEALALRTNLECRVYIRAGEKHNEYICNQLSGIAEITEVENLHAKAIVTDEFVYVGSANITRNGLQLNVELCELIENEYSDVTEYLDKELGLRT